MYLFKNLSNQDLAKEEAANEFFNHRGKNQTEYQELVSNKIKYLHKVTKQPFTQVLKSQE